MTNYEKIRSMSESQLAEYLEGISGCECCPKLGNCEFFSAKECVANIEFWLKEETTDDDWNYIFEGK